MKHFKSLESAFNSYKKMQELEKTAEQMLYHAQESLNFIRSQKEIYQKDAEEYLKKYEAVTTTIETHENLIKVSQDPN